MIAIVSQPLLYNDFPIILRLYFFWIGLERKSFHWFEVSFLSHPSLLTVKEKMANFCICDNSDNSPVLGFNSLCLSHSCTVLSVGIRLHNVHDNSLNDIQVFHLFMEHFVVQIFLPFCVRNFLELMRLCLFLEDVQTFNDFPMVGPLPLQTLHGQETIKTIRLTFPGHFKLLGSKKYWNLENQPYDNLDKETNVSKSFT